MGVFELFQLDTWTLPDDFIHPYQVNQLTSYISVTITPF